MSDLYIITGSNGAGKSTVGINYLPMHIQNNYTVFDGDKLFMNKKKELFPLIARTHKEARNMANIWLSEYFDSKVEEALGKNDTFVYEGHFTNDATWSIPLRFKERGYSINFLFLGLSDTELSAMRVIERSKSGGHYVTPLEIEANFYGNLQKLDQYFEMIDNLQIVDTSEPQHIILLQLVFQQVRISVPYNKLPKWFLDYLPKLSEKIRVNSVF